MNPLMTILCSALVAGLVAGGVGWFVTNQDDADHLNGGDAGLSNAYDSLREIEDKMAELDRELAKRQQTASEIEAMTQGLPSEVRDLRLELASLKNQLANGGGSSNRLGARDANGEEVLVSAADLENLISKKVEKAVTKDAKKNGRRNFFKQMAPMAKMGMQRQIQRNAKKLGLNPEQTKRLQDASNKALEATMPKFAVAMDSEATPEEREAAFTDIQAEMEVVNNDAASYMDSEQYSQFLVMQQEQAEQFQQMQQAFTSGSTNASGVNGGGTPTGPNRSGGTPTSAPSGN